MSDDAQVTAITEALAAYREDPEDLHYILSRMYEKGWDAGYYRACEEVHDASIRTSLTSARGASGKEGPDASTAPGARIAGASPPSMRAQVLGSRSLQEIDGYMTASRFASRAGSAVALLNDHALERLLTALVSPLEWADLSDAVGLVLEIRNADEYVQWLGPFALDTVEVVQAIQTLKAEERDDEVPNQYRVRPLFPPTFATRP